MKLTCPGCGETKPETEHYKDRSLATGRMARCKECHKSQAKAHYRNNVRPARIDAEMMPKPCAGCGDDFRPGLPRQIYCSTECRQRARSKKRNPNHTPRPANWGIGKLATPGTQVTIIPCATCNSLFESSQPMKRTCSEECARRYATHADRLRSDRRRARLKSVPHEAITREAVFERDGWTCGICLQPIDKSLTYPDKMSASLDHVAPVSLGGAHTMDNVQAAHWLCNVRRGAQDLTEVGSASRW